MKRIILIILSLCVILFATGCGKEDEKIDNPEQEVKYATKENLKITQTAKLKNNELLFFLKNKDENLARDVTVEVEFWKKSENEEEEDTYIGSYKTSFDFIKSSTTVVGKASVGKKEYDYFKIFIDIENKSITDRKAFVYDDVIVEDNTILELTDEDIEAGLEKSQNILVTLKNKNKDRINLIEIGVVFYKDNEIVGYSNKKKENLNSMTKSQIKISFPVGNSYSDLIDFDSYRIYVLQAYKNIY